VTVPLDRLAQLAEAAAQAAMASPPNLTALDAANDAYDAECRVWVPLLIQAARAADRLAGCAMHASPETEDAIEAVFAALAPLVTESGQ